jgi:hypothetical protein
VLVCEKIADCNDSFLTRWKVGGVFWADVLSLGQTKPLRAIKIGFKHSREIAAQSLKHRPSSLKNVWPGTFPFNSARATIEQRKDAMINYPIPPSLTREQFQNLVTKLYQRLTDAGLDPECNLKVEDTNEASVDGQSRPRFKLLVSESAAQILEHNPKC